MAAPNYTTDLTTLAIGSITVDTGTWDESSDAGWDTGGSMVDDANLYYNGTACVSAQLTKDSNGTGATGPTTIIYVHGSSFTLPTDGAALIHHLWAAPPALNTLANGGIKVLLGNGLGDFDAWNASGSDFAPSPRGGWANYAINPAVGTADDIVGTGASSPYTTVGMAVGATAQARGNPNACNAVRYGRCESRFTDGDVTNGYATFSGYGAIDSASANKWNLIDPVEGGFKLQGLMSLGLSATSVDFRDSNVNITIANTINVTSGFNRIEIHNASSNIEWTAVNVSALGIVSKGLFEMIDNATVNFKTCVFTDMNTFIFLSNATLTSTTFRRTGLITQGGATFTSCLFTNITSSASILSDDPGLVTDCNFESDGSNHAMELNTAGTYTFSGHIFTNYATIDGSTGNEVIYNNSGGHIQLNKSAITGVISIRNEGASTTTIVASFNLILTNITSGVQVTIVNSSTRTELQNSTSTGADIVYSHSGGETVDILLMDLDYDPNLSDIFDLTLDNADQSIKFQLIDDPNYSNPA